jgi:copper chaperone CopZ
VKTAEADMNAHKVRVVFDDSSVKLSDIENALDKAGFKTTGSARE